MNMRTTTQTVADVTIVSVSGRIALGQESDSLRSLVCDLLSKKEEKILLNLAEVNCIDSSGLGHLVSAFTTARKLTKKVHGPVQITKIVYHLRYQRRLGRGH
jgi:anti-sigma B factor antagonist